MSFRVYDIASTLAARAFAMIGPFVVSIITARVLGPEDRGRYFLVLALAQIGAQMANLGLQSSNTYLVADRRELVGPIAANSFLISFAVAPIVTLLVVLASSWPQSIGFEGPAGSSLGPLALAAVILAPFLVISLYISNLAIGVGRVQLFNAMTIGYGVVSVAIAAGIAMVGGSTISFVLGAVVSLAVPVLLGARSLLAGVAVPFRFDVELFRSGMAFAAKAYLATMFGFIMTRVGAFALQHRASLEEVGQFSVAVQLADGLTMLPSTIAILLFPELVRAKQHQRWESTWRTFRALGAIMLVILAVFYALAPWLVALMFGPSFAKAAVVLRALLPSVMMISMMAVISQYLAAEGFPIIQVIAWFVGLLAQTALSYWVADKWGGIGVALCFALSNAVVLLLLLVETLRRRSESR
jgi:O-antigen/teichoic acid export membrane protein